MGVDVAGVDAAFGQDVDPDIFQLQLFAIQIEFQIAGKGRDMLIQDLDEVGKDRKPPAQISERGIAGISGIPVFLAPVLTGLVIFGDGITGGFKFLGINGRIKLGQGGAVEAGDKERFDV